MSFLVSNHHLAGMAFISPIPYIKRSIALIGATPFSPRRAISCIGCRTPRRCILLAQTGPPTNTSKVNTSTEETFAIDAGRDLFFSGMDAQMAISILDEDLGSLSQKDDRFIAAERLKFFPSDESADALIRFIRKFDPAAADQYILEDCIARRKAVESLGRQKGSYRSAQVMKLLRDCLSDNDKFMVEVAVWALAELGISNNNDALEAVMKVLDNDDAEKRVVIQTLMRCSYTPALDRIRPFVNSQDPSIASAAMAAVSLLSNDSDAMAPVVDILKSPILNVRRSAIEDLTLARYVPAMQNVAVCPNSLVLRARTVRVLLDTQKEANPGLEDVLPDDMVALVDRMIWDHPGDLDLLDMKKETRKARAPDRNIRQLYKNDAVYSYLATKTLAEDHRDSADGEVGAAVLQSYMDLKYFDYFGAYHVYKTLGWLRYPGAYDLLTDNAENLPPRFFNHQAGAITALAELGNRDVLPIVRKVAEQTTIWELKYACLISAERLGDDGGLRELMLDDSDWLVRARARSNLGFGHLKSSFS